VRYAPIEARYKVYIIDEVHMLSTAAFNALLKTLEEPPAHVKFIFATTEIRKLPVTVLSRCQRFDLRRIGPDVLTDHLASIAQKEGVAVEREGLAMIARAAEGSVRDGLSILDQAIVQNAGSGEKVSAASIRDMLGLADRTQGWELMEAVFSGDAKAALDLFRRQYDAGADPGIVLRDMLELVHLLTRVKAAGPAAAGHGAAGEADAARAFDMAGRLSMNALTRAWALLMKGLSEIRDAPDAAAAGEMALIRLAYAADLPTPDEALRALKSGAPAREAPPPSAPPSRGGGGQARAVGEGRQHDAIAEPVEAVAPPKAAPAPEARRGGDGPHLSSFADIAALAGAKRDVKLKVELESYVHLVSFAPGHIEIRLHERAPGDLAGRLTQRLKEWTGRQWIVTVDANAAGAPTMRDARTAEVMAHPMVKKAFEIFPDAEIIAIRDLAAAFDAAPPDTESSREDDDENGD
jgi:DNA polymerase-3 subunit gamma/tau